MLGVKTKHQAMSFRHLAQREDQQKGMMDYQNFKAGPVDFEDFTMMNWRLRGQTITLAVAYLTDRIKMTGKNLTKLSNMAAAI